jgi:hypothetical protein
VSHETIVFGVDPGLSGALVQLTHDSMLGVRSEAARIPVLQESGGRKHYDERACYEWLRDRQLAALGNSAMLLGLAVENLVAAPRVFGDGSQHGSAGAFKLGYGVALWVMAGAALGVPIFRVRPQEWQRTQLVGLPKGKDVKLSAVRRARDLFPDLPIKSKADWGMADAALLARHVLWQHKLAPLPRNHEPMKVLE